MRKKAIGLKRGVVKMCSYTDEWEKIYKKEKKLILVAIGKQILDIQHVGSTSILGLEAKPIVDIAIAVKSLNLGEKCIKPLEKLGYEYRGEAGVRGRHFFVKGGELNRTHYLHIESLNSKNWQSHILFRDYLRRNKEAVKEYAKLKKRLALEHKNDRDVYHFFKVNFIEMIIKKAKEELK